MNVRIERRRVAIVACVLSVIGAPIVVLANHVDSIYPTGSTTWICGDGQQGTIPGTQLFCLSDHSYILTYFVELSIDDAGWGTLVNTMNNQYNPTDLVTIDMEWSGGPSYTGADQTDIIYQRRTDIPGTALGVTYCDAPLTFTRCDQQYVVLRSASPTSDVLCHETGHALGLTHGRQAFPTVLDSDPTLRCMRNPATGDATLGSHNAALINENY